jgi:2-dehydro-3-deoxyphosphogluconate aldolase / (4S)-4-hydroxy-2-oxoglutarate aldolase
MNTQLAFDSVAQSGLIACLRGQFPPDGALRVAAVLMEAGINCFEFTINSVQPIEAMQAVKREYGAAAVVGMGTVLDTEMALRVLEAGGEMVISPAFNPAVIELAQRADVLMIPGVITPTEAVNAWDTGVKMIKIFPIGSLGVDYFKAVRAPLDHIQFCCNGGMDDSNVAAFIKAGAVACGMAGWLTGSGSMPLDEIRRRAQTLTHIVAKARQLV